jgi:hypothetical protein
MAKFYVNIKRVHYIDTLSCDCEVRGHCVCEEVPVIPVNRVVDNKRIMEGRGGGGEAQGIVGPKGEGVTTQCCVVCRPKCMISLKRRN